MTETQEEKKKALLRKKIEQQVACEEKAFRIVERLIDNPVCEEWFISSLQFITPSHYKNVTEERSVSQLCGYPLCPKSLGNVPKQKYFISTKTNKVYDIEDRKNFCSSKCYKASTYLEQQISTEPVWNRKDQPLRKFDLLSLDMKTGKIGEEVIINKGVEMKEELGKLKRLDKYQDSLKEKKANKVTENITDSKPERNVKSKTKESGEMNIKENTDNKCVYDLERAIHEMGIEEDGLEKRHIEDKQNSDKEDVPPSEGSSVVEEHRHYNSETRKHFIHEDIADSSPRENSCQEQTKDSKQTSCNEKTLNVKEVLKDKKSKQKSNQSKTDYLMQLLDKRKSLLSKMADIQPGLPVNSGGNRATTDMTDKHASTSLYVTENIEKICAENSTENESTKVKQNENIQIIESKTKSVNVDSSSEPVPINLGKHSTENVVKEKEFEAKKTHPKSASILVLIYRSVQSWITDASVTYLSERTQSEKEAEVMDVKSSERSKFERQYKALTAKVDAQECDFGDFIGEESLDTEEDSIPAAPAPHFEVLREETKQHQLRVQEFMKGKLTYKIEEKNTQQVNKDATGIVLPTVGRYDQMLIRQKIVVDRISKVLPDLLSPLHLLVQDVFTELRQLVSTFNLTSKNILYKPAEWMLVTLILLKMLSRKVRRLHLAFCSQGSEKYFSVLLLGVGADMNTLDDLVSNLQPVK